MISNNTSVNHRSHIPEHYCYFEVVNISKSDFCLIKHKHMKQIQEYIYYFYGIVIK